jgi:hypothetical protein
MLRHSALRINALYCNLRVYEITMNQLVALSELEQFSFLMSVHE